MELKNAIEHALDGQAILFAGAGFSYGAKNIDGEVPSAKKLKRNLLRQMGMAETSEYSLEIVADFYKKKMSDKALVNELKRQFNIVSVGEHHKIIMEIPWKRVYTTNYDQVVEIASKNCSKKYVRDAIVLSDDFEENTKESICVHINGYIERLNGDKLNNEFKLTDTSYSCDSLIGQRWFDFMVNDFEVASAIIVIGYSMQFDVDIKRLFSAPEISNKVIFIDAPDIDEISRELLENYGKCYNIGIDNFSKELVKISCDYVPSLKFTYKSFRYMYREPLNTITPKYEDIVKFYFQGKEIDKLLGKDNSGEYQYLLSRNAMYIFLRDYTKCKVFIALSNLGNGKSVFLKMVENELRKEEVKVFIYEHRYNQIDQEIESICNERKKCVVIIDNYPRCMDIIQKFAHYRHKEITFLLTARNGLNLQFCSQLQKILHIEIEDIRPLHLNQIQEVDSLVRLLENNSLLTEVVESRINSDNLKSFIEVECKANFSNLLLKLFESSTIKDKLVDLYSGLDKNENETIKDVIVFSLLRNISNYDLSFHEILDLFNADYIILRNDIEFISEIFEQGENDEIISVKSSIISSSLVKKVIHKDTIFRVLKRAFLAADNKNGKTYEALQKSMVSHSQFALYVDNLNMDSNMILVEDFYDNIRNTEFAKHNPFFWEQFALAYMDMKKFDMVKKCLDTALVEAKRIPGFVPFQVRTIQGRYYVEKCYYNLVKEKIGTNEAIDAISDATTVILMHYDHPDNNLYYVFKVVIYFKNIFDLIKHKMNKRELSIFIEKSTVMDRRMDQYLLKKNLSLQYYSTVEEWSKSLKQVINEAKELLKN